MDELSCKRLQLFELQCSCWPLFSFWSLHAGRQVAYDSGVLNCSDDFSSWPALEYFFDYPYDE